MKIDYLISGIQTPTRHVRTRLYFTSESHIYSLLTVLKYGRLFDEKGDDQWKNSLNYLNTVPELNYLTQIVIMLYEDPNVEPESDKRFHVELHFSPGAYADFDVPQYLAKHNSSRNSTASQEDVSLRNSSVDNSASELSNQQASTRPQHIPHKVLRKERPSPFKLITKKLAGFKYCKDLKALPEPGESLGISLESGKLDEAEDQLNEESKPRSFEDQHHQQRLLNFKSNFQKESYNHYNTFHGSVASNYLSIAQVFRNRTASFGRNSFPDLNQNLVGKARKSYPGKNLS